MDEVFGKVGGKLKNSFTDSTIMQILQSAMNKAHERVQSKDGVVERLMEISKFYELAIMQLDGCLMFVQEETDSSLESSDEEVIGDLTEIRDRLEGRLIETELAITEKDRELTERMHVELKLTRALELKERELDSLRANLKLERTKSEGIEELILVNRASGDDGRDEKFSELKNSVDLQVWNIKQKLGPEFKLVDKRRHRSFDNIRIDRMSSDIDILKETMDLAFGKMHKAIFLSKCEPIEQKWSWKIEKDIVAILIEGFVGDVQENFEEEVKKREKQISVGLNKHLLDFIKDITCLYEELGHLGMAQSSPPQNISRKSLLGDSDGKLDDSNVKVEEVEMVKHQEGSEDDGSLVAKMIKSHESIIQKKTEELNTLKRDIQEKWCSFSRRDKEPVSPRRRMHEIIVRLERLINWNARLVENSSDHGGDVKEQGRYNVVTMEDVWQKVNKLSVCFAENEELHNEMEVLKGDKEDTNLQVLLMEETYVTLLEGLVYEFCTEMYSHELEILIRESIHEEILKEKFDVWNKRMESNEIEAKIREEISYVILGKAVKDFSSVLDPALIELQNARTEIHCLQDQNQELKLREEMSAVFLKEAFKEWYDALEIFDVHRFVNKEIYQIVLQETIKDSASAATCEVSELQEIKDSESESFQCVECSLNNDIFMVLVREMCEKLKEEMHVYELEGLIREEIFVLVVVETMRDTEAHCTASQDFVSADNRHGSIKLCEDEILVQKQDLVLNCIEVEEGLVQCSSSYIKEYNAQINVLGLKQEKLDKIKSSGNLLTQMANSCISVSTQVEKALEQLVLSKTLLSQLRSSLCIEVEDIEKFDKSKSSRLQQEENEEARITPHNAAFEPVMEVLQGFMEFKRRVEEKLGLNILRLEEAIQHLNPLVELAASMRKNECLYKQAFIRRSENLRKAEAEVDLLADQVDVLLGLLENVYRTLHHYSPVLQQYFEVSDILRMIKKELIGGVTECSK